MAMAEPIATVEAWETHPNELPRATPLLKVLSATSEVSPWRYTTVVRGGDTPTLTYSTPASFDLIEGRPDYVPWIFRLSPHAGVVSCSGMGMGVCSSGIVLLGAGSLWDATTVLPTLGVFGLIRPAQMVVSPTPLWQETFQLNLIDPGLQLRSIRLSENRQPLPTSLPADPRAREALEAVSDLGSWLQLSSDHVADIAQFSLRSLRYWSAGKSPRPSTVRRLFEIHALVRSVVRTLGRSQAYEWFATVNRNGSSRLDLLAQLGGPALLMGELGPILFARRPRGERPIPEGDDLEGLVHVSSETRLAPHGRRVPRRQHSPLGGSAGDDQE
jgi:hypothetical protein